MNTIPNSLLIEKDIPSRRVAWKTIIPFAQTFNGYAYCGSVKKCHEVARQGIVLHKSNRDLEQSLTDLRTCLFYEARRWQHLEKTPNKAALAYVHALLEAIRAHVNRRSWPDRIGFLVETVHIRLVDPFLILNSTPGKS